MLESLEISRLSGRARARVWGCGLLSAPLVSLAQPPVDIPLIGLITLAPLLLALPRLSAGGAWVIGFLIGVAVFAPNIWWLGQMTTDPGGETLIFAVFVYGVVHMSVFYAFASMTMRWLLTRRVAGMVWLVPVIWVGFEFLHEFNLPGPFPWLPVGHGIAEITPFIQTADLWGSYGISLAVVLFCLGLAAPFEFGGEKGELRRRSEGRNRLALPAAAAGLLLLGCVYGWVRIAQIENAETGDGPLIALVQANLPQEVKVSNDPNRIPISFGEHLELSAQGAAEGADLICWAETMLFGGCTRDGLSRFDPEGSALVFDKDGVPDRRLEFNSFTLAKGRNGRPQRHRTSYVERLRWNIFYKYKTPMLVGTLTPIPEGERIHDWLSPTDYDRRRYNAAILFDEQGRPVDSYEKRFLVPGGEFVPFENNALFRTIFEGYARDLQGAVSHVEAGLRLTVFRLPATTQRLDRDWAFTSSICFEYAFAGCYIDLHEQQGQYPDFHVNISNEGWFKQSAELDQALDFCRFRCIESRIPMVRSTNTGISCAIDACGRVHARLTVNGSDREVKGVLLARPKVLTEPGPTVFVSIVKRRLGILSLLLTFGIMSLMVAGRSRDWRKRRAEKRRRRAEGNQSK